VVEDALEHLVRGIVDNPDDVSVRTRRGRPGGRGPAGGSGVVEVRVHPDDLGRVIGRGGRTAGSFRTIADALAGRRTRVDFVDTTGSR
jgi:predicted RNA-binding protein YlqC (UPF0109 family)